MRSRPVLIGLALVGAFALPLRAEPSGESKQRAAERFESAKAAFSRGEYAAAAELFEQAAAIAPHPATLINAAESWERAGQPVHAAEVCDRITAMAYLDPRYADAANAILRRNASKVATLDVVAPAGGRASVDGGAEQTVPHRWRLTPGTHALVAVDTSRRAHSMSFTLRGGEARVADASPTAPVEPAAPPPSIARPERREASPSGEPSSEKGGTPVGAWVAFGVAGVGLGVGTAFGVRTLMSRDDYNAVPNATTADAFYRNRAIANVGLFTGLAAAGIGAVLLVFASGSRDTSKRPVGLLFF